MNKINLRISNTASTAMMMPIVIATCNQIIQLDDTLSKPIKSSLKILSHFLNQISLIT